eukprot:1432139-Prymnesium_polylepis.1
MRAVFVRATPGELQPAEVALLHSIAGGAIVSSHPSALCTHTHVGRTRCRSPDLLGSTRASNACAVEC